MEDHQHLPHCSLYQQHTCWFHMLWPGKSCGNPGVVQQGSRSNEQLPSMVIHKVLAQSREDRETQRVGICLLPRVPTLETRTRASKAIHAVHLCSSPADSVDRDSSG